ncbi:MAG: hypothetical protein GY822_10775 [Deltaproteobacteria bacterium]|nr:hypothetical protein [Deltaproteobacteria bacterium]
MNYVKKDFFKTWAPKTLKSANEQLPLWQKKVAHVRIHGTTKKRPLDHFHDVEMLLLKPLPCEPYDPILYRKLRVHRDAHVHLSGKLFSVSYKYIGKEAWVKLSTSSACSYIDDERVATHSRKGAKISTITEHLPPKRAEYKERDPEEWLKRTAKMGASVEQLVRDVLCRDDVIRELRMATAMVLLLEDFPKERAEAACARALHLGAISPKSVRDILKRNLDSLPVGEEPAHGHLDEPIFARPPAEVLH